jgi:hypothetical protein
MITVIVPQTERVLTISYSSLELGLKTNSILTIGEFGTEHK